MKIEYLPEPRLLFAKGTHICPKRGIEEYGVFDRALETRRDAIFVGGVGTSNCIDLLGKWVERCRSGIVSASDVKQENLRLPFCGFNRDSGFGADMNFPSDLSRALKNSELKDILAIEDRTARVLKAIDYYYENIKFLAQNRHVDVIVCVIPEALYKVVSTEERSSEDTLDADEPKYEELKPLQLIRQVSIDEKNVSGQQDDATKAWNFCTALYYKSGPTIPWKLEQDSTRASTCAVGISFYRSRDRQTLNTSLAQIFDELGNGIILRGTPVEFDRADRVPRLSAQQAHDLLTAALREYRVALRTFPARVVIHKSSNFSEDEIDGLESAASELNIDAVDFVTVMDSKLRLYRDGNYPPYRGTFASLDEHRHLLYTRGSVWYYQTYPGMYIPQPVELRIVRSEESPAFIAKEILGLTKMNWNNTQFDGKYPVTLGCSRKVGEIMKYLTEYDTPQIRYGYYM
jgi:argonaute-like protein implicated in RNA metabolism and viral defense